MSESTLAVMDSGEANRRILSKDEYRADFRRVEAASLKRRTSLASGEGKRIFARCFYTFQAGMYFVSTLGRTKLPRESIEQIEQAVRAKLEVAAKEVDKVIDSAELLLKQNSIEVIATYDTVPLEIEIGITSALGRRYFELIHKLDQAMPLIQTLEIEEVINEKAAEHQRSNCKRVSVQARHLELNRASPEHRAHADHSRRDVEDGDDVRVALAGQRRVEWVRLRSSSGRVSAAPVVDLSPQAATDEAAIPRSGCSTASASA